MNPVIQRRVYQMGTVDQAKKMAEIGGMLPEETEAFLMLHSGKKEKYIMDYLGMTEKTYANVESAICAKFTVAVFQCICFAIDHMNEELT